VARQAIKIDTETLVGKRHGFKPSLAAHLCGSSVSLSWEQRPHTADTTSASQVSSQTAPSLLHLRRYIGTSYPGVYYVHVCARCAWHATDWHTHHAEPVLSSPVPACQLLERHGQWFPGMDVEGYSEPVRGDEPITPMLAYAQVRLVQCNRLKEDPGVGQGRAALVRADHRQS
jgi:hypothetical protein